MSPVQLKKSAHRVGACAILLLASCSGQTNHETLGDRFYADGNFARALDEYRVALSRGADDGQLVSKSARAAMHAGDLAGSAEAYFVLASLEGYETEAADGLELVAIGAVERDDRAALQAALDGLQEVAAGRALGGFARELARQLGEVPASADALSVLLFAAAGAANAGELDSIMFVYGSVLQRIGRCEEAVPVFESLLRRLRQPDMAGSARRLGARCASQAGQGRLRGSSPDSAEIWFAKARDLGQGTDEGRVGWLGLGDVHVARGNYIQAIAAFEEAMRGLAPDDSLYSVAARRMNAIVDAGTVFR